MLRHCVLSVDYAGGWEQTLEHLPSSLALLGLERLTLVYVIETHRTRHVEDSDGVAEDRLRELAKKLNAELDVEVDYQLRHGFPAAQMVEVANSSYADMLMVLNRSHSAARDMLQGNVVLNLARITTMPLLVLQLDGEPAVADGKVMLAVDGSESNQQAQSCFRSFIDKGRSGLVVWVEDDEKDASAVLESISDQYPGVSAVTLKGSPGKALVQAAEKDNAALLIIGKRGATPINDLMLGSVAQYVIRESHRPVLLVP